MKLDFNVNDYIEKLRDNSNYFHTFINRDSLAVGVLVLKPGEEDTQTPHESDEVYFIIKGNGYLKIGERDYRVEENRLYFVAKNVKHHFHGNTKELIVLYFFGGPDS